MKIPKIMVILAATKGSRMGNFSQYVPKVLLPIKGLPIIVHHLYKAEKMGIEKVIITLEPDLGYMIEKSISTGYQGKLEIYFYYQEKRQGLSYAIWCLREYLTDQSFFVTLGDEYSDEESLYPLDLVSSTDWDLGVALIKAGREGSIYCDEIIEIEGNRIVMYLDSQPVASKRLDSWTFGGSFIANSKYMNVLEKLINEEDVFNSNKEFNLGIPFSKMCQQYKVTYWEKTGYHLNLNTMLDFKNALMRG